MYDQTRHGWRRMVESNRARRGHDFLPSDAELSKIPRCYDTEEVPESFKTIHLHYFVGGADWWLAEAWQDEAGSEAEPPLWMGFGYTRFANNPQGAEWGYIDLQELETLTIDPKPAEGDDPVLTILTLLDIVVPVPVVVERDLHWTPKAAHEAIPGIPAPAHDHGFPWLLAFERLHDSTYRGEAELDQACKQAKAAGAPDGAYRYHDGRWLTVDQAPARLLALMEPHVQLYEGWGDE